jgi:uncharacterized membrane protein
MDFDPSPLFALSLLPYLLFLRWLQRSEALPELAVWGFRLTLLFVLMTIVAAVLALRFCDSELVAVDGLHGGAEAFLTLANAVLVIGLLRSEADRVNNS